MCAKDKNSENIKAAQSHTSELPIIKKRWLKQREQNRVVRVDLPKAGDILASG